MRKEIFTASLAAVLTAGINTSVSAALASDSVLDFNPGVLSSATSSSGGVVSSGSYFGLDSNLDGVINPAEKIAISQNDGIIMGTAQAASGSHGGAPNGSETPGIDNPWQFKNTGMHLTTSPVTIFSDDGVGNVTLDFSGWGITWNGIDFISLGGGTQDCGTASDGVCVNGVGDDISGVFDNGTGKAVITCAIDCAEGDTYTLDYTAVVPQADPSNFGGVLYSLHLEGVVSSVPVPAAIWLFGSGLLGLVGVARRRKV